MKDRTWFVVKERLEFRYETRFSVAASFTDGGCFPLDSNHTRHTSPWGINCQTRDGGQAAVITCTNTLWGTFDTCA